MATHPVIAALDRCVAALKAEAAKAEAAMKELVAEAIADIEGIKVDVADLLENGGDTGHPV